MLFELLLGLALMFLGIGITNMFSSLGKSGTITSVATGIALLVIAFKWQAIEPNLSIPLRTSITDAASNGYTWLAMLALAWIYLAANSLIVASRGAPYVRRGVSQTRGLRLPDFISDSDKEMLRKRLARKDGWPERRVQIIYGQTEKCRQLAATLSSILKEAKWTQPSPPNPAAPNSAISPGITIISSRSEPASSDAGALALAFREIGIKTEWNEDAELRLFEHAFLYIAE